MDDDDRGLSEASLTSASTLDIRRKPNNDVTEYDSRFMSASDIIGPSNNIGESDSDDGDEDEEDENLIRTKLEEDVCKEDLSVAQKWLALPREFLIKLPKTYLRPHHEKKLLPRLVIMQLLLGKNFQMFWRQTWSSFFEVIFPILAITGLAIYLSTRPPQQAEPKLYTKFYAYDVMDRTFRNCHNFIYISKNSDVVDKIVQETQRFIETDILKSRHLQWHKESSFAKYREKKYHSVCAVLTFDGPSWNVFKDVLPSVVEVFTDLYFYPMAHLVYIFLDREIPHNRYEIRMPSTHAVSESEQLFHFERDAWHTRSMFPGFIKTVGRNLDDNYGGDPDYFTEGFILLQTILNRAINGHIYELMQNKCSENLNRFNTKISPLSKAIVEESYTVYRESITALLQRFSVPAYLTSNEHEIMHEDMAVIIATTFAIPTMFFLRGLLGEKESGLRVQLSVYGVSLTLQNLAWLVRGLIVHIIMTLMITFIVAIPWTKDNVSVLGTTNPFIFFMFLVTLIWNALCFAVLLASVFHRVTTGLFILIIIWMASFAPYFYITSNYKTIAFVPKFFASSNSQIGSSIGMHIISEFETENLGIGWSNLFNKWEYALGWTMLSLVFHGLLYLGLAMYTENIFCENGHLVYPFTYLTEKWYWKGEMPPDTAEPVQSVKSIQELHPDHFEDESKKRRRKELEIINLTKCYDDIQVLKNISLTCFYGHVNLVIGGTSEGKTTLINILNGMCPATSGHILVNSLSMHKERNQAQAHIGHCPQITSLYPNLTVEETLVFYARLKGMLNMMDMLEEVERMMSNAYLTDFRSCRVSELTITTQRLLMVTTAFCGGSRVVLLDEPSEGMDACQKRVLWEFIRKEKHHRTILATAEGICEGESCVDKVAILCRGRIQCLGTPKFILARMGGGYFLTLKKGSMYNEEKVKAAMDEIIPGVSFTENEESVCFNIESDETSRFPMLFDGLENDPGLGISDIQLSYVSLEEVQNKIYLNTEPEDLENNTEREKVFRETRTYEVIPNVKMTKFELMKYQMHHLLLKNFRFHFRRKVQFWSTTLTPVFLVMISRIFVDLVHPFDFNSVPLILDLSNEAFYWNKIPLVYLDCYDTIKPESGSFFCEYIPQFLKTNYPDLILKSVNNIHEAMLEQNNQENSIQKIPLLGFQIHAKKLGKEIITEIIGYYNNYGFHMLPILENVIDNLRIAYSVHKYAVEIRECSISVNETKNYSISTTSNPLPAEPWDKIAINEGITNVGFFLFTIVNIGLCGFLATISVMYVTEKKFKHFQIMNGVNLGIFWTSNFIWNFLNYILEVMMILLVVFSFQAENPEFQISMICDIFLMLTSGGICIILLIGLFSSRHSHAGLAFSRTLMFLVLTGPVVLIVLTTIRHSVWYRSDNSNRKIIDILHHCFLIFPSYAMSAGCFYIYINTEHKEDCRELELYFEESCSYPKKYLLLEGQYHNSCCVRCTDSLYDWDGNGVGINLVLLWTESLLFILLNIYLESDFCRHFLIKYHAWRRKKWIIVKTHRTDLQDLVVVDEISAALGMKEEESHFGLCLRNLSKEYPYSTPVDSLNMFLLNGEMFGLLGERHSDKDDLVGLLTGTTEPSFGDIFFNKLTLMRDYRKFVQQIGYCAYESQFLEELTGRETMLLLGALKGTRPETLEGIITNLALKLFILHDLHNPVSKYSHSTLRKLSVACAMLGDPRLCIFDEPSIGIDPESRYYLWNCIRSLAKGGCTVIVSSNNMEECEDCCTRIGMFINGKMRCIGTIPELKSRHSNGYTVVVRFSPSFKERHFTTVEDSHKRAQLEAATIANNERRLMQTMRIDDYQTARGKSGLPIIQIDDDESDVDVQAFLDYRRLVAHELGSSKNTQNIINAIRPSDLSHWEKDLLPFMRYFEKRISSSLLDIQPNFLFYHVDRDVCSWSNMFTIMEEAKQMDWLTDIESYYVGDTSLEQMFLNYIRGQQPKGETTL